MIGLLADLRAGGALVTQVRRFLRTRLDAAEASACIRANQERRAQSWLDVLRRAVATSPGSPYRRLLEHAGIELPQVAQWVEQDGLEATLERLFEAGVYVRIEEFKGRQPIRRGRFELPVTSADFGNPLTAPGYTVQTSGTTGDSSAMNIDLALVAYEAAYVHCYLRSFRLADRPVAGWRGVPPVSSGMNMLLRYAKIGKRVDRWFAQNQLPRDASTRRHRLAPRALRLAGRLSRWRFPAPQYVHQDDAHIIAGWLRDQCAAGAPAQLDTNPSSAVRVCAAAIDRGIDIAGSFFRLGGEPYTQGKADILRAAGCGAATHYSMTEALHVGVACADPHALDDVHLMTDKVAVIQRALPAGADDAGPVVARENLLVFTTLLPFVPKVMINVISNDRADVVRRPCGCALGEVGLDTHLSRVRSVGKLTSEGMNYVSDEMATLVEQLLPRRFGGGPMDYQFIETEERGVPRVLLVVSPRVGPIDEVAAVAMVYEHLGRDAHGRLMVEFWVQAQTLRVERREPRQTESAKQPAVVAL